MRSFGKLARWLMMGLCVVPPVAMAEKSDRYKTAVIEGGDGSGSLKDGVYALENGAWIFQGTLRVTGDRGDVKVDKNKRYQAVLTGSPVCFRQKKDNSEDWIFGQSDKIEYDEAKRTVKFLGRVILHNGLDEMKGDYLLYNLDTEALEIKNRPKERVRFYIIPTEKDPDGESDGPVKTGPNSTPKAPTTKAVAKGRVNPTAVPEKSALSLRAAQELEPTRYEPLASKCTEKAL